MSFAMEVKAEVSTCEISCCCKKAQLSALIQMCASLSFTSNGMGLMIRSENANTAKRVLKLLKEAYKVQAQLSIVKKMKLKKNNIYILRIHEQVKYILEDLQIMDSQGLRSHPTSAIISHDCCKKAYLAGVFLASGSVNSPYTSNYHLEISTNSQEHAEFVISIMNEYLLPGKYIKRRNKDVVYLKASDKISDFLRCIGATECLFAFEDSRIQRDFMNAFTRLDNCELANEMKSISAGKKQLEDIQWIENFEDIQSLPFKIQQVINLRKAHPEASLNELCEHYAKEYNETISKSGMKHRLSKIREIANKYRNE